jgi:type IV secretory pathway TrbD component
VTQPYDTPGTATGASSGATAAGGPGTPTGDSRSLGEIFSAVTEDLSTLIRQEMDLAKTEMKQEIAKAGKGAGLLGGAGVAGYFLLLFLSATLMFALDEGMDLWLAALIVAAIWGIAAAVLAVIGRKKLQEANPQLPKTQQTLKEDAQWAKAQKS